MNTDPDHRGNPRPAHPKSDLPSGGVAAGPTAVVATSDGPVRWTPSDDVLAMFVAGLVLCVALGVAAILWLGKPAEVAAADVSSPVTAYLGKPSGWDANPIDAFVAAGKRSAWPGVLGVLVSLTVLLCFAEALRRKPVFPLAVAFVAVFALATLGYVLAGQTVIKAYHLEYALWTLLVGLLISNTVGTPAWMRPAVRTEFYVKTGLVLLGAEILMGRLMALGLPGVFVAWVVTPIVLVSTFWFGQRVLRIASPSLNMVIAADMSVCGVSAAIASAAACRAKKEELSLAIGLSLSFTVVMMTVMPWAIKLMGIGPVLGGAWMGGTIDATGAVAAAGAMLGEEALQVATTVKMIQNILIGVISLSIAIYWTTRYDVGPGTDQAREGRWTAAAAAGEVWRRFPKFIIGFMTASIVFSLIDGWDANGPYIAELAVASGPKELRGWLFCLAFVSIGLETNFRDLSAQLSGGKPLVLYVAGQSLNLILTLAMAYLMFEIIFPDAR